MSRPGCLALVIALGSLLAPARAAAGELVIDVEAGVVTASRNDVRIPGRGGTGFSLVDDLTSSPEPAFRVRLGYRFRDRHMLTALLAPLRLDATGTLDREIRFAGRTFPAASSVAAVYRFDSYRLTYRYSFVRTADLEVAGGLTGKIRDAAISLYGEEAASKKNTGFVPLLDLHAAWRPGGGRFGLLLEADALAAPQGRAEDILLAATWAARDGVELRVGYRMLEGGVDNDEVRNLAWLHYAVAGVELSL